MTNKLYIWHTQANTSSSSFTTFSFSLLSSPEFMMAANFLPASFLLFLWNKNYWRSVIEETYNGRRFLLGRSNFPTFLIRKRKKQTKTKKPTLNLGEGGGGNWRQGKMWQLSQKNCSWQRKIGSQETLKCKKSSFFYFTFERNQKQVGILLAEASTLANTRNLNWENKETVQLDANPSIHII